MNLLSLTYPQLIVEMNQRYGRGAFHAAALYRAFYQTDDLELGRLPEFVASPRLIKQLEQDLVLDRPNIVDQFSDQGVTKLVFGLTDGHKIETVVIPMANHATVCVSSQVGCRMGCRFCRTAQMGFKRNLNAGEIVAQVYAVKVGLGLRVRNVVFMGMGEPLDNLDQVAQAIRIMEDQRGLDIAKRRMTVSTAGLIPGIRRLAHLGWPQLRLAVSLNAPCDDLRDALMPLNRTYPLASLKACLKSYPLARGNAIFMEYVLIEGINDHPRHARQLADYVHGLEVKLNLIACNPRSGSSYKAPSDRAMDRFHRALIDRGIFVRVRSAKGAALQAACGQLGA